MPYTPPPVDGSLDGSPQYQAQQEANQTTTSNSANSTNTNTTTNSTNSSSTMGIKCSAQQLSNGQCSLNVYDTIGIRKDQPETNVKTFVQDFTLSATFFIGTVVAVALMYSGWLYITAKDDAAAAKGKNGIKWSLIGVVLVFSAYSIVRLVQYVAKG